MKLLYDLITGKLNFILPLSFIFYGIMAAAVFITNLYAVLYLKKRDRMRAPKPVRCTGMQDTPTKHGKFRLIKK